MSEPIAPEAVDVSSFVVEDDGTFPNNTLAVMLYRGAFAGAAAAEVERVFARNGWAGGWRDGVLARHHYHSSAHEVLGCYAGSARLQLGGPAGRCVELSAGDVAVIPAGVAHKRLSSSRDFAVVGAYPDGQRWDMCYGEPGERPRADDNIARVGCPSADPLFGAEGPLRRLWR